MSDTVQIIKERLSIIDVVGQYVELQHAGKSFKGKSPFTNEKTPSFFVSPDRGMYYCFSSQKGGDIFTFIQEMEGVDFKGALKILAEKAGVELVQEDPAKRDARETQYALLEEATQYFFRSRDEFPHVNEYVEKRGVTGTTIHTWRIGYARDEWRALKQYLASKGFTEEQMTKAGLIKKTDPNKESYDVFRDRIMFPIADASGRVVAFSGRTLKSDPGVPKYVNSPETELFQKSEILYGYDKAKQGIRHYDFSLVVEGQFDLVLSHQAGYSNTVAVSGTALTPHHLMLLERLSSRIVLALDSDRAGISAVKRSSGLMLEHGMDVKVARMEGGKDPADIIKANPEDFKRFIGKSVHVVEFLLGVLKEGAKDERTYKLRVREELLPLVVGIQNRIDREHFEGLIAEAIGTTKDAIHYEVERIAETKQVAAQHARVAAPTHATSSTAEASPEAPRPTPSTARRDGLVYHLYAFVKTLPEAHAALRDEVQSNLARLIGDEYQSLETGVRVPEFERAFFEAEARIERAHIKELMSDLSTMLTTLSHLIARDRLAYLRREIEDAERIGDDGRVHAALEATREAQELLGSTIDL